MSILARVTRNLVALTTSLVLERAVSFILFLVVARALGADALGDYALALSFLSVFETASVFGQNLLVVREVARDRESAGRYLVNSSALVLLASLFWAIAMPLVAKLLGYPATTVRYAALMALVMIPDSLSTVPESVIQGWERMEFITLFRFVTNLAGTAVSVALLLGGASLDAVFLVLFGQRLLLGLLYAALVWRRMRPSLRPDWGQVAILARLSLVFLGMNVFAALYKNVDVWILRGMDAAQAGYYSAADRPVQIVGLLAPIVMVAVFPSLSESYRTAPERFARILQAGMRGLFATVPFIAMLFTLAAPGFISLAYGTGYESVIRPLQILAWSLVPTFVAALLFRALLASNNERVSLRVAFVNMVVNVTLNLILIPRFGAIGASVAALVTPIVGLVQNYWHVSRHLVPLRAGRALIKPALGILLSGAVFLLVPQAWNLYVRGSLSTAAYVVFLIASGAISRDEMAMLLGALRDLRRTFAPEPDRS